MNNSNLERKSLCFICFICSLQKEGREGHTDNQQVKEVEGIPAEGAGVQKSSINSHLHMREKVKKHRQKLSARPCNSGHFSLSFAGSAALTLSTISTVKTEVNT